MNSFLKMNRVATCSKKYKLKELHISQNVLLLSRVSPTRPAPFELPQGLTAARVESCSGAM